MYLPISGYTVFGQLDPSDIPFYFNSNISLQKQMDFLPVALCLQYLLFGNTKQQAENPSVFAGYSNVELDIK